MGWTSYHATRFKEVKRGYKSTMTVDVKREMDEEIFREWETSNGNCKLIKSAMYGSTYYGAIQKTNNNTKESEVFAVVVLTSVENNKFFNMSYKDMDETMLPFYYDCPESILKLLTPTDNENANIWREKCRKRNKDKKVLAKHEPIILTVKMPLLSGHKPGVRVKLHWDGWGHNWFYTDGVYRYSNKTILNHGFEVDSDYQLTKKALDL